MAPSRHGPLQTQTPEPQEPQLWGPISNSHGPPPPLYEVQDTHQQPYLNIHDLRTIAADIKDTLSAAIADLRLDIHTLNNKVQEVEKTVAQHGTVLRKATKKIDTHTLQMQEI